MKVIKEGRPQKGWAKEYQCSGKSNNNGGCGAILLVEENDLFYTYQSFMGRDEEYYTTFRCSECGVLTDVPHSDPPNAGASLPSYREWKEKNNKE